MQLITTNDVVSSWCTDSTCVYIVRLGMLQNGSSWQIYIIKHRMVLCRCLNNTWKKHAYLSLLNIKWLHLFVVTIYVFLFRI